MIRKGIYKLSQLESNRLNDLFNKSKNISVNLYQQLSTLSDIEKRDSLAEIILNRFNTDRNVIKRTYRNRFNTFDLACIEKLRQVKFNALRIHDMAISDGRASCFFLEKLSIEHFKSIVYHGSDLQIKYQISKLKPDSKRYVVTDEKGKIIEITSPPFVWNFQRKEGKLYFINNLLKTIYYTKYKANLKNGNLVNMKTVQLSDLYFLETLNKFSNYQLRNYNLFDKPLNTYNVIRAMNILHFGYFSKSQISHILQNIFLSLEQDGIFIEGSNEDAGTPVEGAIYKKTSDGFQLIDNPEKASRIQDEVLSFKLQNAE